AGKNDFGIPERKERGNLAASDEAKNQPLGKHQKDPRQPRAEGRGTRTSGVGAPASGPGSSSGGDVDTDVVGVGTGGSGVSQGGGGHAPGPDDATGTARDLASGPPTRNTKGRKAGKVEGSTVDRSGGDIETTAEGRGAAAVS